VSRVPRRRGITSGGQNGPCGAQPATLHHQSHEQCFIANSIKTQVNVE
jgi:organic hydroperoxide reductase OsmC/OhrA